MTINLTERELMLWRRLSTDRTTRSNRVFNARAVVQHKDLQIAQLASMVDGPVRSLLTIGAENILRYLRNDFGDLMLNTEPFRFPKTDTEFVPLSYENPFRSIDKTWGTHYVYNSVLVPGTKHTVEHEIRHVRLASGVGRLPGRKYIDRHIPVTTVFIGTSVDIDRNVRTIGYFVKRRLCRPHILHEDAMIFTQAMRALCAKRGNDIVKQLLEYCKEY